MKHCSSCNEEKPLTSFYRDSRNRDGRQARCKVCQSAAEKKYYYKDGMRTDSRRKSLKESQLKRLYNIDWVVLESMIQQQSYCCAICGTSILLYGDVSTKSKVACVDHNHTTHKVRGLLCNSCNRGLGFFKDKKDLLKNAALYLEKFDNE